MCPQLQNRALLSETLERPCSEIEQVKGHRKRRREHSIEDPRVQLNAP